MGALSGIGRVVLVVVNILFLLLGLVFFGIGLFIRFGSSIINDYIDDVKKDIETSSASSGLGTIDLSSFDLSDILLGLALGFIFFGLFLVIISVFGCCGGCCKIKTLLLAYVITCIVLLVAQVIVIGILYGSPDTFHDPAKKKLKDQIQSDYIGLNGTNVVSVGWNIVMQQVGCCGPESYNDFTGASQWVTNYAGGTIQTPLACCKTLPSSSDFTCATTPTASNNYYTTGCYDKIWDDTLGNSSIMIGSLVGIAVFQLILIIFGIIILCSLKRKNRTKHKD